MDLFSVTTSVLSAGSASVSLASHDSHADAVGFGTLTLRSRATGSTLVFERTLHVPTARRTLVCLGKSMRSGVYWHFDDNPCICVHQKGIWGRIILASNDLLFVDADVLPPQPSSAATDSSVSFSGVEVSHAE
jgi:hypothetical protein